MHREFKSAFPAKLVIEKDKMYKYVRFYSNAEPDFEEGDVFRLVVPMRPVRRAMVMGGKSDGDVMKVMEADKEIVARVTETSEEVTEVPEEVTETSEWVTDVAEKVTDVTEKKAPWIAVGKFGLQNHRAC